MKKIHFFRPWRINQESKKNTRNSGAAMLISVIFFLFISLAIISGLVGPTVQEFKITNDLISSRQSFFLSESAGEDAYFRLKTAKTLGSTDTITLGGNSATATIADSGYNQKLITSLGDVSSRQRKNELLLTTGVGISFSYGIQSGVGGFVIGNAVVNGNVYSNGNITGNNGAAFTGSAFTAGGIIDNIDVGSSGTGDARGHTVKNSTVVGNLYCQIGSNNDKPCNTSQPDLPQVPMPITEAMIDAWKADAELGGTTVGNLTISTPTVLGPQKITGNLAINSNLTITGTLYVVGNITTNNNAQIALSSSYGAAGGIIVADGRVVLSNNAQFAGSGTPGTYILLTTTSTCPIGASCAGNNAIDILNNVGAVIVNGQNGTVHLNNNVTLNEVVGEKIIVDNSATVNYLSGFASQDFNSGPSGGWNIKSWKEVK